MPTSATPQVTDFSRDVIGRYVCNGLDEALRGTDRTVVRPDGRPQIEARDFDLIVIGGGTFGAVAAEHMSFRDRSREHRILVLEGGPLVLPEHVQNLPVLGLGVASATSIAALKKRGPVRAGQTATGSLGIALAFLPRISWPGLLHWRTLSLLGWLVAGAVAGRDALAPLAADGCRRTTAATLPGGSNGYFRQAKRSNWHEPD